MFCYRVRQNWADLPVLSARVRQNWADLPVLSAICSKIAHTASLQSSLSSCDGRKQSTSELNDRVNGWVILRRMTQPFPVWIAALAGNDGQKVYRCMRETAENHLSD